VGLAWSESPVCSASDTHTVTLTILVTLGLILVIGHRGKDCHYCCYLPLSMGIIDSGNFSSGGLVAVSVNRHFGWVRKFDFFIGLRLCRTEHCRYCAPCCQCLGGVGWFLCLWLCLHHQCTNKPDSQPHN